MHEEEALLHAFDATTGKPLFNSTSNPSNGLGSGTSYFLHFTVIDGQVFIPTYGNGLVAYRLRE